MARGRKTGGRRKGSRNRATEEARVAAKASGILPLDYMLSVMRNPRADDKRRDAMAAAAAPYLHAKLCSVEPKPTDPEKSKVDTITVHFVHPTRQAADDEPPGC
jgi:hypothetical protein